MIEIKINDKDYKLPESWDDVTLKLFREIIDFDSTRTYNSETRRNIDLVSLLLKCDSDEILTLSTTNFRTIMDKIGFINQDIKPSEKKEIFINGISYMFPIDLGSLSIGEVVSIETIIQNDQNDLKSIMAILLRPSVRVMNIEKNIEEKLQEKFDMKNWEYRKDLFDNNLMISDAIGITTFFLSGANSSSKNMKDTLEKEKASKVKKQKTV